MTRVLPGSNRLPPALAGAHPPELWPSVIVSESTPEHLTSVLSMLRCSECGDLLDAYGSCPVHGLLDIEGDDDAG